VIIVSTPYVTPVFSVQCSEFRGSRSHEGEGVFPEHSKILLIAIPNRNWISVHPHHFLET